MKPLKHTILIFSLLFLLSGSSFYHKHLCIRNLPAPCLLYPLLRHRAGYLCGAVTVRRTHSRAPRRYLCTAPVRSGGFPRIQKCLGQSTPSKAFKHHIIFMYFIPLVLQNIQYIYLYSCCPQATFSLPVL